jgi:putative phosphoribosyl transferase
MPLPFRDRHDAGRQLSDRVVEYAGPGTIVLGLPRGGVPVAYEVAHALHAPLDVLLLRHMVTGEREAVVGLVGSGGVRVLKHEAIARAGLTAAEVDELTQRERVSLMARERTYRGQTAQPDLTGRTVILADDGSSSELELQEALQILRQHDPARVILAVPVIAAAVVDGVAPFADAVVAVVSPGGSSAPERWHREFMPISHTEVRALLSLAAAEAQSRELATATAVHA